MAGLHKFLLPLPPGSKTAAPQGPWQPLFPNPADITFNYANLLLGGTASGLANVSASPAADLRIAIIGAGYGGLTTARELFRSGFRNLTIYEATNRIAGRGYTVLPNDKDGYPTGGTPYELGAMRIPFFEPTGGSAVNSVMKYFVDQYDLQNQPFPDPGSPNVMTGIYMNEGYGPVPDPDKWLGMIRWLSTPQAPNPPNPDLTVVYEKWSFWAGLVQKAVAPIYGETQVWQDFWHKMVQAYNLRNFRDVALLPPRPEGAQDGDFGGLGLTIDQANVFYTIGAGDGSWGAFFDIAALYPIRTLLFGYANSHHLLGNINLTDKPYLQEIKRATLMDSRYNPIQVGLMGVASIPEMHFVNPVSSSIDGVNGTSLYQHVQQDRDRDGGIKLFTQSPVVALDVDGSGYRIFDGTGASAYYDLVVFTTTGWANQMTIDISPAANKRLFIDRGGKGPWTANTTRQGMKLSHNITSAKIFFKLKKQYWSDTSVTPSIPQVIVTDTYLQDAYGYAVETDAYGNPTNDPGVLLCSYTWEDDSNKMLSAVTEADRQAQAWKCLATLDQVMTSTGYPPMSNYVDETSPPVVWHWEEQNYYRSCAKLYRSGCFDWDYAQLSWNQNQAGTRGVYFAGEFASLEGGWIEPAMRGAIDAVVHLISNTCGTAVFQSPDMIANYPVIPDWNPTYPVDRP